MKKLFFLAAVATMTLASCMNDELVIADAQPADNDNGMTPILFNSLGRGMTRADFTGKEAADKLNNMFVVSGYKGSTTTTPENIVFDNYLVKYAMNTANTTESNSNDWEYVNVSGSPIKHALDNGITSQTIKYWDYSKTQYDFIAWSTGKDNTPIYEDNSAHPTLDPGEVRVTEIVPSSATTAAYTFEGTAEDLSKCFISDIVTVKKGSAGAYGEVSGYGNPVTLKFRQLGTKVRIGIYETVPGYSVKNVQFYTAAAVDLDPSTKDNAHLFTTTAGDIYRGGTYTIHFPTVDTPTNPDNNQAHITFSGAGYTQDTKVNWGTVKYRGRQESESLTTDSYLGRTSNTASFAGDPTKNYYDFFLPNETGTNLNLRVDYTLESIDGSQEEILVRGATAQVPSIYTTWKPGYAYTYLFKISDKTNGHTGVYDPTKPDDTFVNSDPAGLYPITFDAIVVNAEDDNYTQETITLVSTPSITTYQNGSKVVNNNEYTYIAPSGKITGEIYVTVNDGEVTYEAVSPKLAADTPLEGYYYFDGAEYKPCAAGTKADGTSDYYHMLTPSLANSDLATLTGKVALYEVADGTTEASVIDAMQYQDDDKGSGVTIQGRNGVELTETTGSATLALTNSVTYGVDGNTIPVSTDQAAKFVPTASKTYAFVYTKTAADPLNNVDKYAPITYEDATVNTKYRYKMTAVGSAVDVQENEVYAKPTGGTPALAIEPVFLGQGAGNLYTFDGAVYTAATTNYAVTGTNYFYDLNGVKTAAHPVAYADFAGATLYVKSGAHFVAKTEPKPKDGVAYYYLDGGNYVYCVIYPEQTAASGWYTVNTSSYENNNGEAKITGMTYFDKYTKNDGVYYTKVIKVQAAP